MDVIYKLDKTDKRIDLLEELMYIDGKDVIENVYEADEASKIAYVYAPNHKLTEEELVQFKVGSDVYCGKKNYIVSKIEYDRKITVYEMLKDEDFAFANAMYTAEAAISILANLVDKQLNTFKILIIGYGRCGKSLVKYLYDMRTDFTVLTSKPYEAKVWGNANDYSCCNFSDYDIIINTAPFQIIKDEELKKIKPKTIIMDLASAPYGLNHMLAKEVKLNSNIYPALPAKKRLYSATQTIYDYILKTQGEIL